MNVAVLTSPNQWFEPYARHLASQLGNARVFTDHSEITQNHDALFILGYHRIIEPERLKQNKYNLVIHESDLPSGKGWAPLFWQVIEGKSEIVFTMFNAASGTDDGDVVMRRTLTLNGYELNSELRKKQAELTLQMCLEFYLNSEFYLPPSPQLGPATFYEKRTPSDSELDPDKTLREQFNLLRTVDNEAYPAFFKINGRTFLLRIYEQVDS